jgi:hypothetical protein
MSPKNTDLFYIHKNSLLKKTYLGYEPQKREILVGLYKIVEFTLITKDSTNF